MKDLPPFRLMYLMFAGFAISFGYGIAASSVLFLTHGLREAQTFLQTYVSSFNTLISLGLILGTALIVGRTQSLIPRTIEDAFEDHELQETRYPHFKALFCDRKKSIIWSAELALASFLIFLLCKFPGPMLAENLMVLAACAEYTFGVYVGRKLFYSGLMLHALLRIPIRRNLFKERELDDVNTYVNVASTLTVIFGYVHLDSYFNGPFLFQGPIGESARVLLLLPVIIGTPVVLIFNFYPRMVLRQIYSKSIDVEIDALKERLKDHSLTAFEMLSYLIEFEKQSRDELRYRLRLTLSDLPIGLAVLLMALQALLGN
jgi:hypothetical protein